MYKANKKPFDPRTDKMLDIESDSGDNFKKSLDNFNPEKDVSKSLISEDFKAPYPIPGQMPLTFDDEQSLADLRENLIDGEMRAKGMININKKLPPKIPIEHIIRKNKKDMPSIKDYAEMSKKSASTDSHRKYTPSTEKRLSRDKDEEDDDDDDEALAPFDEEQRKIMKDILNFNEAKKEKEKIEEEKLATEKVKKTKSASTKTSKKPTEDITRRNKPKDPVMANLKDVEAEYDELILGKTNKKRTETSSELSDTTEFGPRKTKKIDDTWDNKGIKFVDAKNREDHPMLANFGRQPFSDEEIKEAFKVFDLNRNGYIGAAEVKFILDHLGKLPQ
jgi:hypothetical protein